MAEHIEDEPLPVRSILTIVRRRLVAPAPCPRMRFIVYLGEMLKIKMRIDLSGGDTRVSQKLLYRS